MDMLFHGCVRRHSRWVEKSHAELITSCNPSGSHLIEFSSIKSRLLARDVIVSLGTRLVELIPSLLSVCCFTPIYGRLCNIIGRQRTMITSLVIFGEKTARRH